MALMLWLDGIMMMMRVAGLAVAVCAWVCDVQPHRARFTDQIGWFDFMLLLAFGPWPYMYAVTAAHASSFFALSTFAAVTDRPWARGPGDSIWIHVHMKLLAFLLDLQSMKAVSFCLFYACNLPVAHITWPF
jgi:hypothetical protein